MSTQIRTLVRRVTMILMLGFFVIGSLFAGGYAMQDPGGTAGLLLIAEWVVPAVILAVLAWRKSPFALPLLVVATAGVVAVALLDARDPMAWQQTWDQRGPVLAVSGFSLSMALAVYGRYQRTRLAGALLVASCGVSLFAGALMGTQEGPLVGGSTSAGVLPGLVAGVVYLLVGDN